MEYITLKETGVKRFGIRTKDGQDTGEYIELDLEDIELPLKASECQEKHIENFNRLKEKVKLAGNLKAEKEEHEIMSQQNQAILKALKEYYEEDEKALDMFLGEGATKKLLAGRKPYVTMFDDINEYLNQIVPDLEDAINHLDEKIKAKYKVEKEDNIL